MENSILNFHFVFLNTSLNTILVTSIPPTERGHYVKKKWRLSLCLSSGFGSPVCSACTAGFLDCINKSDIDTAAIAKELLVNFDVSIIVVRIVVTRPLENIN